jgi:hypothetical protein
MLGNYSSTRRFRRYVKKKGGEYTVKITTWFLALLLFSSVVASTALSADGILLKEEMPGGYCHLQFPAIREETLSWDRPVLKDADSGDRIDYYGSCDHDPLGKDEIESQKDQVTRALSRS